MQVELGFKAFRKSENGIIPTFSEISFSNIRYNTDLKIKNKNIIWNFFIKKRDLQIYERY